MIVGESHNIFGNNEYHGFLLKIFKDGSYTSTYTTVKSAIDELLVFPNPTDDYLQVVFKEKRNEGAIIRIFNQSGHQVLIESLEEQKSIIDLNSLVPGSYYYTINIKDSNIYSCTLIKQ